MSSAAEVAPRLRLSTILSFAAGGLPITALGTAMAISVQPYLAQNLGVGLIPLAFAFFIVRMLDMGVDPVLAVIMDRTRTPLGRYRIWSMAGVPILMLAVWQLFMAHKGIGVGYLVVWLLVYYLGTSIVGLSRAAWSANIVTRYADRSRFYGFLGFATVFGILIALGTPIVSQYLGPHRQNDVQMTGWAILVMIPLGSGLTAWLVPERLAVDAPSHHFTLKDYWALATKPELLRLFFSAFALTLGPGWMSNLYIFFFTAARGYSRVQAFALLIFYVLAGVVGAPLIGMIGARFSKHRTMIAATICYSLGLCTVVMAPKANMWIGVPIMVWCGFMANGFDLMTSAMMADVGDQVRLEQGKERMALLFAITGLANKLAAAGAVIIAYPLLASIGYAPTLGIHNSASAINGLTWVFITGPIFFVTLGGACLIGWRLDSHKHAEIRAELDARDELIARMTTEEAGIL